MRNLSRMTKKLIGSRFELLKPILEVFISELKYCEKKRRQNRQKVAYFDKQYSNQFG